MQYFRELQSLLQQFIIVEHAVDPAVDPSVAVDTEQQQLVVDEATLLAMKQESHTVTADEMAAVTEAAAVDMAPPAEGVELMDTSAEPSAMETSSATDNQMAFEEDPEQPVEPFISEDGTVPSDIA